MNNFQSKLRNSKERFHFGGHPGQIDQTTSAPTDTRLPGSTTRKAYDPIVKGSEMVQENPVLRSKSFSEFSTRISDGRSFSTTGQIGDNYPREAWAGGRPSSLTGLPFPAFLRVSRHRGEVQT